ncbi:hypothetical protein AKN87_02480 [Thiopseudomonas alkaliphila]|uniref:Uncharacterized protein n=1 Tax=Thiopseudomonas alkaliphila TaxID=1697053 RepID=A0A0K1XBA9_9GAMM|nr:hypothetical protein [Thiopseudomonas alkaliphila]AKX44092.1 hypothetical protein AKN87_02480 [Thiopseudomonas alkaliphila]AKX46327.1 hypothetical protein AKN94_02335 [Thiopseudomonas alkaliphila]AKX49397.1 hypothetical protein AKN93_08315 [Thiopseudomonas alkaliphila]AKX50150.1 hypothetical protein AKN92_00570 [Thiopseudomonas alkaliphila]AKX52693.1 hypothetical protein AKN91_02650 [Thiopseudomonas alkaliphila]
MNRDLLAGGQLPPDRKTLIRMRMELRRQQMRKEVLRVAEPVVKLQAGYEKLSNSYLPLIGLIGTAFTSLMFKRQTPTAAPVKQPVASSNKWFTAVKALVPIAGAVYGLYKSRDLTQRKNSKAKKDPFHLY